MTRFCLLMFAMLGASSFPCRMACAEAPAVVLDCDTANEIDDLYAIARMLRQDRYRVLCLSSAQWFHYLGERDSIGASQRDNEDMLRIMGREDLPAPRGSAEPMGKPWGGFEPKDSPAARFIIREAKKASPDNRLAVICTGASTNLASAIKLAPEIAPRIDAYILGFQYDAASGVWNKSEFNIRRDLNAADFLLNQTDLQLHIMPTSVAGQLKFEQHDSFQRQAKLGALGTYLTQKWTTKYPDAKTWTMWDVALIEAILDPSLATEKKVNTPPENHQRKVWMYTSIDQLAMSQRFWSALQENND